MTTALAQIQEEIVKLEARLKLWRAAETALLEDAEFLVKSGPTNTGDPKWPDAASYVKSERPSRSLAAAIRELLTKEGPMTKASIDERLSEEKWGLGAGPLAGTLKWELGKGSVSGALQAMKARGVVARTKAGKWTVK